MKREIYNRKKLGLPPGTILNSDDKKNIKTEMELYTYDGKNTTKKIIEKDDDLSFLRKKETLKWLNLNNIDDLENITKVGKILNINPLVLEDLTNTNQRTKIEEWENYIFIVLKIANFNIKNKKLEYEQISFILGENYLITFKEKESEIFNVLKKRIEKINSEVFKRGIGYVTYSIIDILVDNYFIALDCVEEKIDNLERKILNDFSDKLVEQILKLKSEISYLKKEIYPVREIITKMQSESILLYFKKSNRIYLSDLHDHSMTVCDILENMTSRTSELFSLYYSILSNNMNNVMKVLAIISTIFMPLSFLAGLYGMNFKYIPELNWKCGYFILLGIMGALVLMMFLIFKKKKWL